MRREEISKESALKYLLSASYEELWGMHFLLILAFCEGLMPKSNKVRAVAT
jgi:hypothetical protein